MFEGGGRRRALVVRRHRGARGLRLRVDPRDGRVLLTLPARGSLARALRWAEEKRDWVEAELARIPAPRPILPGAAIPFRGEELPLDWRAERPRRVRLAEGRIVAGGPESELANRVLRWLKAQARSRLTEETHAVAARAGVAVSRVGVGDPRSRWGSCSSSGAIRYSWRLVMAPDRVLGATVAHEVAHRIHMHHGPEFHALVAELFGADPAPERRWLRDHGPSLYWIGCSS